MFVAVGARGRLQQRRHEQFERQYIEPLVIEAHKLGIDNEELKNMIDKSREGR